MQSKRNEKSKNRFNAYVNKLIAIYRETKEFKGKELASELGCYKIPRNRFDIMRLGDVDRELTIDETERVYNYVLQPKQTEAPLFGQTTTEETKHPDIAEAMEIEKSTQEETQEEVVVADAGHDNANDSDTTEKNTKKSDAGSFRSILNGVRNRLRDIFSRKKCYNTLIRYKKYQDGSEVFAWVDNNERIDYILKINGYRIERCGRVTDDEAKLGYELGAVDVKQLFRAFSILKRYVAKLENNVEKNKAKLDAIEQILVMDGKNQ
jgi:hypothetical protein